MNKKQTKTSEELAALVTAGLKRSPECSEVTAVAIDQVVRIAEDRPNWHAAFTMAGNVPVPSVALQIVGDLAAEFDLT